MQVEETEFYRTRNGNVLGPFTHKPHIGWIVPGLRVSWDNDGRLRRSTIEEHPLDLIAPATIVEASLAPLEERSCEMSDEEGHLFEAVDQLTSKGHGYIDLDNEIVVFTEKGFVEFAKNTFIIGDPMQRIQSGIEKLAYINKRQMRASVDLAVQPEHETLRYHKVLTSHDPMEAYRGKKTEVKVSVASDPQSGRLAPKLGDVRLTFPSLQAKRDVRPEDSKFTMSLSFPGTVSREQVERIRRQVDETVLRRRAEMADTSIPKGVFFNKANGQFMNLNGEMMAIDFYLRWIGRNHLFPATYEDAWDAIAGPATEKKPKVNEALGEPYIPAAEQMRNYIDAGRWIDGKPLDTMKPGIRRFLEEIGTTNALGDLIGVMQTNAYSLTAQYKRAGKAGVICVEVELPKAITVDVAR